MRKVVAGLLISLDGVVESPNIWGWAQYMNDEMLEGINAGIAEADTVLLGRRTYLDFIKLWFHKGSETPMADFLNNSPKYVVSSSLDALEWQPATLIQGNLHEATTQLKQESGKNIQVPGSPTLVRSLLAIGLLDEISLNICPVIVGSGMRLFEESGDSTNLKLIKSKVFSNGVLSVTYQVLHSIDNEITTTSQHFPEVASQQ